MYCFQLDFPDESFVNPAYAFQINVSYILSNTTYIMGHTTLILFFEYHFKQMPLMERTKIAYKYHPNDPLAIEAFEGFFYQVKENKKHKHLPNALFLQSKKMEKTMNRILDSWVGNICNDLEKGGFYAFSKSFQKGVLENFSWEREDVIDPKEKDLYLKMKDVFGNQIANPNMDKLIWMMPEIFYNQLYFGEGAIVDTEMIEEGKPYLVKCLTMPNINLLKGTELGVIRDTISNHIAIFDVHVNEWTNKCYKEKNGNHYFRETLMPMMATVQQAIDNNPLLMQWGNIDSVKTTSAIYFGEVSPLTMWQYYKDNGVLPEELYKQLQHEYAQRESYTIPVMVFAYNMDKLTLQTETKENEMQFPDVVSVRKYMEL